MILTCNCVYLTELYKKSRKFEKSVDSKRLFLYNTDCCGSLVKRLRRRPLTAKTGVRFPYELFKISRTKDISSGEKVIPFLWALLIRDIMTGASDFPFFPSVCFAASFISSSFTGSIFFSAGWFNHSFIVKNSFHKIHRGETIFPIGIRIHSLHHFHHIHEIFHL